VSSVTEPTTGRSAKKRDADGATTEPASSLGVIVQSSLREEARRAIRAGVITGEIKPGQIYSAPSLAARLGVSATPVREALLDLAGAGLVESVRNRGFRVVVLGDSDLDEIFELRSLLEVPSVGRVAGRLDADKLNSMWKVLEELEAAARAGDLERYLTADQDFHTGLLEPLGNARLIELIARLRDQQRLYGLPKLVHSELFMSTASEHRAILEAVAEGDKRRAETLTRQHLRHTRGVWAGADEPEPPEDA
jgi:DNA-binding GntR family transcriptional regulator